MGRACISTMPNISSCAAAPASLPGLEKTLSRATILGHLLAGGGGGGRSLLPPLLLGRPCVPKATELSLSRHGEGLPSLD